MRLSGEQQVELLKKLGKFLTSSSKCISCGNETWNVSDVIFELREFHGGGIVVGGDTKVYPVVAVTCTMCGHTLFFNALLLGVVEPSKKEQPKVEQSADRK